MQRQPQRRTATAHIAGAGPAVVRYALQPAIFPHSQHAYERMLSLPIYTRMGAEDVQRVIDALRTALQ